MLNIEFTEEEAKHFLKEYSEDQEEDGGFFIPEDCPVCASILDKFRKALENV